MVRFVLFGVVAQSLDNSRQLVETAIGEPLEDRDGLHMGGIYYSLGFPETFLRLRRNIDLDDDEGEFEGLHEPDFPNHPFLLYLSFVDAKPRAAAALKKIEANSEVFERLREE